MRIPRYDVWHLAAIFAAVAFPSPMAVKTSSSIAAFKLGPLIRVDGLEK